MLRRAAYALVPEDDPQWMRFWALYPRRAGKKNARKAWRALNPSPALVDRMIQALDWQVRQPQWTKDGGAFIPYPATWLNGERWADEPPARTVRTISDATATVFATLNMGGKP